MSAVQDLLGSIERTIPNLATHLTFGVRFHAYVRGAALPTAAELEEILTVVGPPRHLHGNQWAGYWPAGPGETGTQQLPGGYDLNLDPELVARARAEVAPPPAVEAGDIAGVESGADPLADARADLP